MHILGYIWLCKSVCTSIWGGECVCVYIERLKRVAAFTLRYLSSFRISQMCELCEIAVSCLHVSLCVAVLLREHKSYGFRNAVIIIGRRRLPCGAAVLSIVCCARAAHVFHVARSTLPVEMIVHIYNGKKTPIHTLCERALSYINI